MLILIHLRFTLSCEPRQYELEATTRWSQQNLSESLPTVVKGFVRPRWVCCWGACVPDVISHGKSVLCEVPDKERFRRASWVQEQSNSWAYLGQSYRVVAGPQPMGPVGVQLEEGTWTHPPVGPPVGVYLGLPSAWCLHGGVFLSGRRGLFLTAVYACVLINISEYLGEKLSVVLLGDMWETTAVKTYK